MSTFTMPKGGNSPTAKPAKLVPFSVKTYDEGYLIIRSAVMDNGKRRILPLEYSNDDLYPMNTQYTQADTELLREIQRDYSATHQQMQERFEAKTGKPYPF